MKLILSAIVLAGLFGAAQAMDGPVAPGHAASSSGEMQSPMSGGSGRMGHKSDHKGKKTGPVPGGAMQRSRRSDHMMGGSMRHTGSMQGGAMRKKHHHAPDQDG